MINRYLIFERYEHWAPTGKVWTEWFKCINSPFAKTEAEAKAIMKQFKKDSSEFDRHTKLKYEYEIRFIDIETLPKPSIHYSKKGRPSKQEVEEKKMKYDNYWKLFIENYDNCN